MEFKEKIKSLRKSKNWSQDDVANKLNISLVAYSKIERGITDINLSRIIQLAEIYDINISELFGEENNISTIIDLQEKIIQKDELIIELYQKIVNSKEK